MLYIFSGITILDLTKVFSGPFATRQFADYGATVLKIETLEKPDDSRNYPPLKKQWSGYYELLNRNKKGISLALRNEKDRQKFYRLVKKADVIVENLTPKTKYSLHIDYETVKKYNEKIIYASLAGVGQHSNRKYYDILAQAESGLLSLSGSREMPAKIGPSVVDAFSGMTLAFAIASALYYRERTGKGQWVDVSMLASAMNLLESNLIGYSVTKKNPIRTGNQDNLIAPFGIYRAKNGFVAVATGSEVQWKILSRFLHEYVSFNDVLFASNALRLKNAQQLTELMEMVFQKFTKKQLLQKLSEINIPSGPVNEMQDVYNNIDLFASGALKKVTHPTIGEHVVPGEAIRFSSTHSKASTIAPSIGEHNSEYDI